MLLRDKIKELTYQELVIRKGRQEVSVRPPYRAIPKELLNSYVIGYEEKVVENKYIIEVSGI